MTVTLSTGHDPDYVTKQVAAGKENYYTKATDAGEAPGIWQGTGAEMLGLRGIVDAQDMKALFGHFVDPRDPRFRTPEGWDEAEKLGAPPRKYASPEEVLVRKLVKEGKVSREDLARLRLAAGGNNEQLVEALAKGRVLPERLQQMKLQAQKEARNAVSYIDMTFSPQKSISIFHAACRAQEVAATKAGDVEAAALWGKRVERIEAAIWAGNNAALKYAAEYAGYSRVGYHGKGVTGRYIDAHDLTVASFFQQTSRANDMQLHIHNIVLNRVLCSDGKWRTLDGSAMYRIRPMLGALAERITETRMMADPLLQVAFEMRPDGMAREIVGITKEARDLFSSRARETSKGVKTLVDAFVTRYDREPNALELSRLSKKAALACRPRKTDLVETPAQRVERWAGELRREVDQILTEIPGQVIGRTADIAVAANSFNPRQVINQALEEIQGTKAAWTRSDLLRALNSKLPDCLGDLSDDQIKNLLHDLADAAINPSQATIGTDHEVILLTAPDMVETPQELRLANGRSAYDLPGGDTYAIRGHLVAEEALESAAKAENTAPAIDLERLNAVLAEMAAAGTELGTDQRAAVTGVLTSGRRLETLIGPAGTGKSFTVGTIADLWSSPGMWDNQAEPKVSGLATSQKAVDVLGEEGLGSVSNIDNWLSIQGRLERGRLLPGDADWKLAAGDLLVVDESGMTPTADLAAIERYCRAAGVKLLFVGDDRQLTAVGAGGALRLTSAAGRTYRLDEVRRFEQAWERKASLRLREGDAAAVQVYERHGRVVDGGTLDQASTAAARGWLADTLAGKRSLLVVDTNDQAADLSARLRADLVSLGMVEEGGVPLRDQGTFAGVGDVIQARRNDWSFRRIIGRAVVNRELYQVVGRGDDGSLTVRRIMEPARGKAQQYGREMTMRPDYVAKHVTLGYAVTVHAVQGATVKTTHSVATRRTRADAIYVALSRGTESNTVYLETVRVPEGAPRVPDHIKAKQPGEERTPAGQLLAGILERHEPDKAASEVRRDSLLASMSLETLGPRWVEAVQMSSAVRYASVVDRLVDAHLLTPREGQSIATADGPAGTLWRLVRNVELAGHDPFETVRDAVMERELATADSVPKVLWDRIEKRYGGRHLIPEADTFAARTPQGNSAWSRFANGLADAMDTRVGLLGEQVAATRPEWAIRRLGPVPDELIDRAEWIRNAGLVAAYREQYSRGTERDAIGACPQVGQPEARAAWHAAWRALGQPEQTRDEATLSVAALRDRVTTWAREQSWAPKWVDPELRDTVHAARNYHQEARILAAQAQAEPDHRVRADMLASAAGYAHVAAKLDEQVQRLTSIDDARTKWFEHTGDVREAAETAATELERRGVDLNEEVTITAEDVLADGVDTRRDANVEADTEVDAEVEAEHDIDAEHDDEVDSDARKTAKTSAPSFTDDIHLSHEATEVRTGAGLFEEDSVKLSWTPAWPEGVPTIEETVAVAQHANDAMRIIEDRHAAELAQHHAAEAAELEAREAVIREEHAREADREAAEDVSSLGLI